MNGGINESDDEKNEQERLAEKLGRTKPGEAAFTRDGCFGGRVRQTEAENSKQQ